MDDNGKKQHYWAKQRIHQVLLHGYRSVSTVTFSQSHRHLLQNIITWNLHSEYLLSAMLLCTALVSDFYQHRAKLIPNLQLCASTTSIQIPVQSP